MVETSESDTSSDELNHFAEVNSMDNKGNDPMYVSPRVNGGSCRMQIDTGSARSIITLSEFKDKFPGQELKKTSVMFKTYTGQLVQPNGKFIAHVKLHGQKRKLPLFVVPNGSNALLGRDWLRELQLNWAEVKAVSIAESINSVSANKQAHKPEMDTRVQRLIDKHKSLFSPGVGKLKHITAKFTLKPDAVPKFVKARPVPFSQRDKVGEELDKLEKQGIISKVSHSEWGSPIVVVPKKNGDVRICADFKSTLNPALIPEQYPLPKIQDLCASFRGEKFSKIDLTKAYHTMEVDPDHRKYLCITTHKSLYVYNNLPMGVTDASAKWQKTIEMILNGIDNVIVNQDDIGTTGANDDEHLDTLSQVFTRLEEYGLKANVEKCTFMQPAMTFCGHRITKHGIQQMDDKIQAITDAPRPENQKELSSFLGLVNYYHRFVPNISRILKPLYELTTDGAQWDWNKAHENAFMQAKHEIASDRVLAHYDPKLPVHVQCDAGPNGLGVVMSHIMPDNTERPVIFLSRTLKHQRRITVISKKKPLPLYGELRGSIITSTGDIFI